MKECCEKEENLEKVEKEGQIYLQCRVCSCRHFEMFAEKGHLGVEGTAM